jgi:hypothetical protein
VLGRRLVLVSGLIVGDYLLWNWSLNHNHGALALFSGLTLPPLAIALVWLLVLVAAKLLARYPEWHNARASARPPARSRRRHPAVSRSREDVTAAARSDKIAA